MMQKWQIYWTLRGPYGTTEAPNKNLYEGSLSDLLQHLAQTDFEDFSILGTKLRVVGLRVELIKE